MLVDLFADCLPTRKKRRWHFNTFMLETFSKLENLRRSRTGAPTSGAFITGDEDYSLMWLAKDLIQSSPIIFLDEFQMPDRVASKILTNLMTSFFHLGGVLVATSNRMPEELAKAAGIGFHSAPQGNVSWQFGFRRKVNNGIFGGSNDIAAFLDVLKARCEVWEMEGGKDYRRSETDAVVSLGSVGMELDLNDDVAGLAVEENQDQRMGEGEEETTLQSTALPSFFKVDPDGSPLDESMVKAIDGLPSDMQSWSSSTMTVYGRKIHIPRTYNGVALWNFAELCKTALGPADYITLASTYHTFILTDVPVLNWLMKNEARRLITLLDALYECRCKLLISAKAGPDEIFFPDEQERSESGEDGNDDAVYSETLSEVYQDATAPFRPNILTQNPNYAEPDPEPDYTHARLAGLLNADALEDDPPNNVSRQKKPFGRSFGRTDGEMIPDRKPIDPDEPRYTSRPNFQNTRAFTGEDERFAYKRAQSRLWEMCSARWWAREEPGWHRPLPVAVRSWESSTPEVRPDHSANISDAASDIKMGDAVSDNTRDERSFKTFDNSPSPFRHPAAEPPKFSWTHIWGTIKWGPRAGAWGQGPEGLKDRGSEKR